MQETCLMILWEIYSSSRESIRDLVMSFSNSSRYIILLECLKSNSRPNSSNLFSYAFFFLFSLLYSASVSSFSPLECRSSFSFTSSKREEKTSWCSSRRETISSCVDGICPVSSSRLWSRVSPATNENWVFANNKAIMRFRAEAVVRRVIIANFRSPEVKVCELWVVEMWSRREKAVLQSFRFLAPSFQRWLASVWHTTEVYTTGHFMDASVVPRFWRHMSALLMDAFIKQKGEPRVPPFEKSIRWSLARTKLLTLQ